MRPIIAYLKDQAFIENKEKAYKLSKRSAHFARIIDIIEASHLPSFDASEERKLLTYSVKSMKAFVVAIREVLCWQGKYQRKGIY